MKKGCKKLRTIISSNCQIFILTIVVSVIAIALIVGLGQKNTSEIAEWFSAIGTVGAVIVSLYLANKPKKPAKLSVRSDVRVGKLKDELFIYCDVYFENRGEQEALIERIDWYCKDNKLPQKPCGILDETIGVDGGHSKVVHIFIKEPEDFSSNKNFEDYKILNKMEFDSPEFEYSEQLCLYPSNVMYMDIDSQMSQIRQSIKETCFLTVKLWSSETKIKVTLD
ncbi:hypothetical protein [Weissella viridescens]|uniref:hypothetical protein n=1 Tax=Weissella viridescens TaxID=1629 RepID=UPI0035287037